MLTSKDGCPMIDDRVEPLSVADESATLLERQKPLVTHAFATSCKESRVAWQFGWFSVLVTPVLFCVMWLHRVRFFERYKMDWMEAVFAFFGLFGMLASVGAILFGVAELAVWVFQRKQQPTCWRTLAGMCLACVLPMSLIPASTISTPAQLRCADMNSLRRLGLANLNYESLHGYFPPMFGKTERADAPGKGLSWRVHILPFLDEAELYAQFRLDEPWDSPHNLALLPKMPEAYESRWPLDSPAEGYTLFQRPVGHGAVDPGDGKGIRFRQITDGSSNTILIVQVNSNHAVPWTKPADYVFDPADPLRGLGGIADCDAWLGQKCDGSTYVFECENESPTKTLAMFTRDAGDTPPEQW